MSNMQKMSAIALLLGFLAVPGSSAGWSPGENLITPAFPSEEWEVLEKRDGAVYSRLWQKKGRGFDDSYVVTVISGYEEELVNFRNKQDAPGRANCERFESDILEELPANGYSRQVWLTRCVGKDGFNASILHVAIQGRESFYHIQKTWRFDVPEGDLLLWQERLITISVCDTRDPERSCPEGYNRAQ